MGLEKLCLAATVVFLCLKTDGAHATICNVTCTQADGTSTTTCWDFLTFPYQCQEIADGSNHSGNVCYADWSLLGNCPDGRSTVAPQQLINLYLRSVRNKRRK
jgi:hypothetical protein